MREWRNFWISRLFFSVLLLHCCCVPIFLYTPWWVFECGLFSDWLFVCKMVKVSRWERSLAAIMLFLPEQLKMINTGKLFTFLPRGGKFFLAVSQDPRDRESEKGGGKREDCVRLYSLIREWFTKQHKMNKLLWLTGVLTSMLRLIAQ